MRNFLRATVVGAALLAGVLAAPTAADAQVFLDYGRVTQYYQPPVITYGTNIYPSFPPGTNFYDRIPRWRTTYTPMGPYNWYGTGPDVPYLPYVTNYGPYISPGVNSYSWRYGQSVYPPPVYRPNPYGLPY